MVVPTYNERERLAELVRALYDAADAAVLGLELVIVDDNSPDGTGAEADALATQFPIRVVHRAGKLGLGTAVVEGFHASAGRIVGVMDADFSHPPSLVPLMFKAFITHSADVLVASRYLTGGSTPDWPLRRRVMSRTACLLARGLSPIRDAVSGFFLIRRELALETEVRAGGFKICLELVVRSGANRLVELPFRFTDRELGQSKMSLREAAGYLVQLRQLYADPATYRRARAEYRPLSPDDVTALANSAH